MQSFYYVGLDVHKKTVSYAVKTAAGEKVAAGSVAATRAALSEWAEALPGPWVGALEATLFTGWIHDHLEPYAAELQVAHPAMLKAIACAKKKNDRLDAEKICDLARCDLLPGCYMAPGEIRQLRRVLRYRNLLVREAVRLKNKISGLLMECGEEYVKERLHGQRYFYQLLDSLEHTPESALELLALSRGMLETFEQLERRLLKGLARHRLLAERVQRLQSIRGVGQVTALTWALEVAEPERFPSVRRAVSYCGLCAAQRESAGKTQRTPLSKQRNKHLQTVLIEAAKLAPRFNPELKAVHERELLRGSRNRATLAVARKLAAYLLAVDRSGQPFAPRAQAA
jgi:transposase